MSEADRPAIRKSVAMARLMPTPTAGPSRADTVEGQLGKAQDERIEKVEQGVEDGPGIAAQGGRGPG